MKPTCWILVSLVAACAAPRSPYRAPQPDRSTKLNEPPRPMKPRADDSVTLYQTKVPEQAYVEVSLLTNVAANESDAVFQLKRSAATVGCDGIVLRGPQTEAVSSFGATAVATEVSVSATCIMFRDDPGTWRPALQRDECAVGRERIMATPSPEEKRRLALAMPPECHTAQAPGK